MKKVVFAAITLLLAASAAYPQQTGWSRTYGGEESDGGSMVIETSDGNYAILGGTVSFGAGGTDIWLLKINDVGDTLWTKIFGGNSTDFPRWFEETADSGFIIAGRTHSYGAGQNDIWLLKTNSSGDTMWTRTYGGSDDEYPAYAGQTEDGGYIIIGSTESFTDDHSDLWILITDSLGDTTHTWFWEREPDHMESLCCANRSYFGGYVIVEGFGYDEYNCFIELNPDGSERWNAMYMRSWQGNLPWSIRFVTVGHGGYVLAGSAYGTDPLIGPAYWIGEVWVDPFEVTELWAKTVDVNCHGPSCIQPTSDTGYIAAGGTCWELLKYKKWDTLWTKTYEGSFNYVIETPDSGLLITGSKDGDLWLIKTDANGDTIPPAVEEQVTDYPADWDVSSPVGARITLRYFHYPQGFHASVFDASGRLVDELHSVHPSGTITWGDNASRGVYFVKDVSDKLAGAKKVVIVK